MISTRSVASTVLLVLSASVMLNNTTGAAALNARQARNHVSAWAAGQGSMNIDSLFREIEKSLPGFGGVFLDDRGKISVSVSSPESENAAIEVARAIFAAKGYAMGPTTEVQVVNGRYSFTELSDWHEDLKDVHSVPGVVLSDVDEAANKVRIGIEDESVRDAVQSVIDRLRIPQEAVEIVVTEPIQAAKDLDSRIRPLIGGIKISFDCSSSSCSTCTLGFVASRGGVSGFVTNSHCTSVQGGVQGTAISQPGPGAKSKRIVGFESVDSGYFTGGSCPSGRRCRFSDSAFIRAKSSVKLQRGGIARPTGVGSLIISTSTPRFRIVAEDPGTLVGEPLVKIGQNSGWTQGSVASVCSNLNVSGTDITLLCQDRVSATSVAGDSGSPVFRIISGSDVRLYGVLWGSSSTSFAFSPMKNVLRSDELGPD